MLCLPLRAVTAALIKDFCVCVYIYIYIYNIYMYIYIYKINEIIKQIRHLYIAKIRKKITVS